MQYTDWSSDIFGQSPDADPVTLELRPETNALSAAEHFDFVDRALCDPDIHRRFSREQIAIGLQLIYENTCSSICFCYIEAGDDERRVAGIRRIKNLYRNYFDRYCQAPVGRIGYDHLDGRMGYLCYMLWDVFVLYPGSASPTMVSAALDVMADALQIENDNCIVSAVHGLGHWANSASRAVQILQTWLHKPNTRNPVVLDYARQATTGCIQ